jgi:hypothetical protein
MPWSTIVEISLFVPVLYFCSRLQDGEEKIFDVGLQGLSYVYIATWILTHTLSGELLILLFAFSPYILAIIWCVFGKSCLFEKTYNAASYITLLIFSSLPRASYVTALLYFIVIYLSTSTTGALPGYHP